MIKPRILQIVRPVEGGILIHLKNLLKHLADDFTFTVACPFEMAAEFESAAADVFPLTLGRRLEPYRDMIAVGRLAKLIKRDNFVLVHAHGFKAGLVARPAARIGRVPCLVTIHNDFAGAKASRLRPLYYTAERWLSRWTTGYVTVSEWLAGELAEELGISTSIKVIPNGIALGARQCETELPFPPEQPVVATVARLARQKGVEFFIRAAAQLALNYPELRFLVVGDGPLRPKLESLAAALGLGERLFFMGYRHDVPAILARLTVYVQPSLSEGQGITVLEAMAADCPVVASAAGGLRELVRHGKNGILVEPGSVGGLVDAVSSVLNDPLLAERLRAGALDSVGGFEIAGMIDKTRSLYQSVMDGRWPHEVF
ncbi:MAG: glycosyltransferase family 4 protein [Dethiobacter sp.]|nr:glycosyltransferase family 4 protein [Dethiobacter sp.]